MITGFLIFIVLSIINLLILILPEATALPTSIFSWVSYFNTGASILNQFLPLGQFFSALGLFITIEGVLLGYKIGVTVFGWIRGGR